MKWELANGDLHSLTGAALMDISIDKSLPLYAEDGKTKIRYAAITKEIRYPGKRTNHSSNYMQGPNGLMEAINEERIMTVSLAQSKTFQQKWQELYFMILFGGLKLRRIFGVHPLSLRYMGSDVHSMV